MYDLDTQLLELYQEIKRKEKLKIHILNIRKLIGQKQEQLNFLEKDLAKEELDVVRLEQLSLFSIFKTILGNKKEQLEKERQEYLQVFLQCKGVRENIETLMDEVEILEKSFSSLHAIDKEFRGLLIKKEKLIKEKKDNYLPELNRLNENISNFQSKINEITVAIKEGDRAKKFLHKIIVGLGKIEQWGDHDSTSVISKINREANRVRSDIYVANNHLQKYEDELRDLCDHFGLGYTDEIENLNLFLKRFIDCLITDWVVKNKIENSLHFVANIVDKISRINAMLEQEAEKNLEYIKVEEKLKGQIIVSNINNENQINR